MKIRTWVVLMAGSITPFLGVADEEALQKIDQAFIQALEEGKGNEFFIYHQYMLEFIQHPVAAWEVRNILEEISITFDAYWKTFTSAAQKYPNEEVSLYLTDELLPIIHSIDRKKMIDCLLLGLFGIAEVSDIESHQKIQALILDVMVKKRIAAVLWDDEPEKKKTMIEELEERKLATILQICSESEDPFLHTDFYSELEHSATMSEYVQDFDMKYLEYLEPYVANAKTYGEKEIQKLYNNFAEKIEQLKTEYSAFIDF